MNCLYVAKRIGGEALSIPQLMKQDNIELSDDAVGIVCPVWNTRRNHFGWRLYLRGQAREKVSPSDGARSAGRHPVWHGRVL